MISGESNGGIYRITTLVYDILSDRLVRRSAQGLIDAHGASRKSPQYSAFRSDNGVLKCRKQWARFARPGVAFAGRSTAFDGRGPLAASCRVKLCRIP